MPPLQKSCFSTRKLPAAQGFEAWRESIGTLFDVKLPEGGSARRFDAHLTSYLLNSHVMLTHCQTSAQHFVRTPLRCSQDGLDHYIVQTHLRGSQTIKRGRASVHCGVGDLMVIDLADSHSALTTDFANLSLVVPRRLLAPRLLQPDTQEGRVLRGDSPLATLMVSHLRTLADLAPRLSTGESLQLIEPTMQVLAAALNGTMDSVDGGHRGARVSQLARAKLHIEHNLHRPLTAATVSRRLNLSKATLYRLFEPYQGVRTYIQERRLRRCAEALMNAGLAHLKIYEIAFQWGFASEAHFSRAFREKFGISPSEARALSASGVSAEIAPAGLVGDREYETWLSDNLRY